MGATHLFSIEGRDAADFGTRVHQLFEGVEWWDAAHEAEWVAAHRAPGAETDPAMEEMLACVREPELGEIFVRQTGKCEVWRERGFEIVLEGEWVTGVFDRVMIKRDADGRAVRAEIIDFKTDRVESDADVERVVKQYAAQLELYRRALARLAGLAVGAITCRLLLTRLRRAVLVGDGI